MKKWGNLAFSYYLKGAYQQLMVFKSWEKFLDKWLTCLALGSAQDNSKNKKKKRLLKEVTQPSQPRGVLWNTEPNCCNPKMILKQQARSSTFTSPRAPRPFQAYLAELYKQGCSSNNGGSLGGSSNGAAQLHRKTDREKVQIVKISDDSSESQACYSPWQPHANKSRRQILMAHLVLDSFDK